MAQKLQKSTKHAKSTRPSARKRGNRKRKPAAVGRLNGKRVSASGRQKARPSKKATKTANCGTRASMQHETVERASKASSRLRVQERALTSTEKAARMQELGLVQPTEALSRTEFEALQAKWYKKAEQAGFEDIEWTVNPNSPHIKRPASRGRQFTPGKALYYALARNFATHGTFKTLLERRAWEMHADGMSYRRILKQLKKRHRLKKSVYWLFYFLERLKEQCEQFNKTHPEGMLNPANQDSFADDVLLADWGLQLDEGYWESVPRKI